MKKTMATLFVLMALAVPASAKDVYVTSVEVAASQVRIFAMDETIGVNGDVYAVMTKAVYPDGNSNEIFARFVREQSGWRADYGNTSYGYIVDWPPHVEAIFDWLMDRVLGRQ